MSGSNSIQDVQNIINDDRLEYLEHKIKTFWNEEKFSLENEKNELIDISQHNTQEMERLEKMRDETVIGKPCYILLHLYPL